MNSAVCCLYKFDQCVLFLVASGCCLVGAVRPAAEIVGHGSVVAPIPRCQTKVSGYVREVRLKRASGHKRIEVFTKTQL